MSFDSDHSDVEVDGDRKDEEQEEQVQQPARKRKARQEVAAEEAKPAKKAKNAAEESRVGRVVAVPTWKFGREWADKISAAHVSHVDREYHWCQPEADERQVRVFEARGQGLQATPDSKRGG